MENVPLLITSQRSCRFEIFVATSNKILNIHMYGKRPKAKDIFKIIPASSDRDLDKYILLPK
jgi:hypothetical protein